MTSAPRLVRLAHAAVLAVPFVGGCTSLDSVDVRTNGIHPDMLVRSSSENSGSTANVALHVGSSLTDFVKLEGEDKLTLTIGAKTKDLVESNVLGAVFYTGELDSQAPGDEVTIALARGDDDEDAPVSKVTFGPKLSLTSPASGASLSRANDDLVVSWSSEASEDGVLVELEGECIQDVSRQLPAGETSVALAKGSILKREPADGEQAVPDSCEVTVEVSRSHAGTLDPAFGGGSIRHLFVTSVKVTTTP